MSTMQAITFHEHGGVDVLRYESIPVPELGPGEVLVRVRACSVNRGLDAGVRETGFGYTLAMPHVCGADPSGEIAAIGPQVDGLFEGQRVTTYPILACGHCDFCLRGALENYCRNFRIVGVHLWGGYAQFVKLPAANVVPIADDLSFEAASVLPVSYLPVYHGLLTLAGLRADDTILIQSAGSGIGMAAMDIARSVGARVIATAGSRWKLQRARDLGADLALDYGDPTWPDAVREATGGRGISVLFDNVGRETWQPSLALLDRGARVVCSGATADPHVEIDLVPLYRNMISFFFHMQGGRRELDALVDMAATGTIAPVIDSRYPLAQAAEAQAHLERRGNFGKVVLIPPEG